MSELQQLLQDQLSQLLQARASLEPAWLQELRQEALTRFAQQGLPTTKHEDWKYTRASLFTDIPFQSAFVPAADSLSTDARNTLWDTSISPHALVFVDGHFDASLSSLDALPAALTITPISQALQDPEAAERIAPALKHIPPDERPFDALNLAFFTDGVWIHLPKNASLEDPLQLVFLSSTQENHTVIQTRNLITAEENATISLVEVFAGTRNAPYWSNTSSLYTIHPNANVKHHKVQLEDPKARHLANLHAHLHGSSRFANHIVSFGGQLVRNDTEAVLGGSAGECTLNGLYFARDNQHIDNRTFLDHAHPHCNSFETYKGVLDDHSTGTFNGKILVRQDAQKTDAKQANQALLLSDNATINSKPQLEIFADDVKCTHGATSGNIDTEALFYLRSRGLSQSQARALLTYAFANELLDAIDIEPLRERLEAKLHTLLHA